MSRRIKKAIYFLLGSVVISITGLIVTIMVYHDAIRLKAEQYIDSQIDASVTFDHVSITFLSDFPNLTLTLHNLVISGNEEFEGDTLALVDEFDIEIKTVSLFSSGETEVKSVHLLRPQLQLKVLKSGKSNFDIFFPDSLIKARDGEGSPMRVKLDQVEVSDGTVSYQDEYLNLMAILNNVDHIGAGDFQQQIFDFRTKTAIGEFTLDYGKVRYLSKKEVEVDLVMEMNLAKGIYTMKENIIRINHFKFGIRGNVTLLEKSRNYDLQFVSAETEFKNLISLIPGLYMHDFNHVTTSGELKFSGNIRGSYSPEKLQVPSFLAEIKVKDGVFRIDSLPDPIDHIQLDLEISNAQAHRDSLKFDLKNFQFDMRGHPVRGRVKLQGLDQTYVDVDLVAEADLAELEMMYPISGVELSGKVNFELKAKGPIKWKGDALQSVPAFKLDLKLHQGRLKYDHLPAAIDSIQFHWVAENKSGSIEETIMDLRHLHMDMGKNVMHGFARVEGYKNLKIKMDIKSELDLEDIEKMFPMTDVVMKGHLSVDVEANGVYNQERKKFPTVDAHVELKSGFFQTKDYSEPLENVHMSGEVVNTTGNFGDTHMTIRRLTYSLGDEPFEVRGTLSDMVNYTYDLTIKGLVDLKKLAKYYPVSGLQMEGIIISDVETKGTLADLEAGLYERTFSNGQVEIRDLVIQSPAIRQKIEISNALFILTPEKIVLENFKGKMGRSNVLLKGDLFNYLSFATQSKDPIRCDLDLKCDTLDLNEWFAEQNGVRTDGAKVNQINIWQVPSNLNLVFDSEVNYVLYEDMKISKFDGEVRIKDGILTLHETGFNSLNAAFSFSGIYDTRDILHPKIDVDLDIKELDIAKAYKEMKLVRELLPAAGDAEGRFSITYKLKSELAQDFTPKLETLTGGGTMRIAEAKFNGMKVFEELSKASKKDQVNDPHLRDFVMRTEIRDNKIYVKPFSINVSGFAADVEGVSEISGSLRYLVKIELLPFNLKIPFHVTGTYDKPIVTIGKGHVLQPGDSLLSK